MSYSELCQNIKNRMCWDKILFFPNPHSKIIQEGYRLNITTEKKEDIEQAKEFLKREHIVFEDKKATSFSPTIRPGDRTLRVTLQSSVVALRKMWVKEFEKSRLAQSLKEKQRNK